MANSSDTFWSVNNVSLQTFAQNIETVGGEARALPEMRGEDVQIPYSQGDRWVEKTPGPRTIGLKMWVRGTDSNGAVTKTRREHFEDNWRALQKLIWRPHRQLVIRKKLIIDGSIRTVVALGEFAGGMEPTMIGRTAAKFVVNFRLADPFFYDENYQTASLVTGNNNITVGGDYITTEILAILNGSRYTPQVRAVGDGLSSQVQYNDKLFTGDMATLDIKRFKSTTKNAANPSFDSSSLVTHAGAKQWLRLSPGANVITLSSLENSGGACQLQWKDAYL